MDAEKGEKLGSALSWARTMLSHIEGHCFKQSFETDKAAVYLRQALDMAGQDVHRHRLSEEAMYVWLHLQQSVEELKPLDEPMIVEKLKLAQAELHRLFSDEELEEYRKHTEEHKDDYAWVTCV